jgi:cytochrome c oxidase accessory protein FixG
LSDKSPTNEPSSPSQARGAEAQPTAKHLHVLPAPSERVLSTLNADGSRRWLRPRVSVGRFLSARRALAWFLIALFTVLPFIRIHGAPAILLDIARRQFTLFGKTFLPTDTVLLAVLLLGIVVSVFLITAVLGRVWCGWACPQTVYMEFVYRPLERLFEGPPGRGGTLGRRATGAGTAAKYIVYLIVSMGLAHTFLSYFVGVDNLRLWMTRSPVDHPTSFAIMAATTGLMFFDFTWFREQTCIVACPYGRLQSVLIDRDSLIVSYDPKRGEPRGHGHGAHVKPAPGATAAAEAKGDCIDCGLCVETCPTGIDIREGLRMECIGCAQCIDACDAVMGKIQRPLGLIRYSSQGRIAGEAGRVARPRLFVYAAVLTVIAVVFSALVSHAKDTDVTLLRGMGVPFTELPDGEISNPARLKITNRSHEVRSYRVEAGGDVRLITDDQPLTLNPTASLTRGLLLVVPANTFVMGKREVTLKVVDDKRGVTEVKYRLLGPYASAPSAKDVSGVNH